VLLHEPHTGRWLLFREPLLVLAAAAAHSVRSVLREAEKAAQEGYYAAGFISYEAAPAFDPALRVKATPRATLPLAWFGIFSKGEEVHWAALPDEECATVALTTDINEEGHHCAVQKIRELIHRGDTYQVNFSSRAHLQLAGTPWQLFQQLISAQGAHYGAFINTKEWSICCASPELFFRREGEQITCRPMKGTAPRGLWHEADLEEKRKLVSSEKQLAENLMIVDMVRNDLGRIAIPGSVQVERLFEAERYRTLWQLTSTVSARSKANVVEIFDALFPAASITGAPKVRTMEIISDLEQSPRGIYTGAIGLLGRDNFAQFNVAIRTAFVNKQKGSTDYGVGSGIVWDSRPELEFEECRLKTRILTERQRSFDLVETLLWEPGSGYYLLEKHLTRIKASAEYFDFSFCEEALRASLSRFDSSMVAPVTAVRITLSADGKIGLKIRSVEAQERVLRATLALSPIQPDNPLLYHKTSDRSVYEECRKACPGQDEVLLWNEQRELTEATIANVAVEIDGQLLTPAIHCGLLPGVYRSLLLEEGVLKEAVITLEQLREATRVFLLNSVRRMWEIQVHWTKA